MPTTVRSLFEAAGVAHGGVVRWEHSIPKPAEGQPDTGIYAVALTADLESMDTALAECPISQTRVRDLLKARPELRLDGKRPTAEALITRLQAFWYPDEVVVYIGRAGPRQRVKVSALSDRVAEYYVTPLGARGPHAGGWPIKLLEPLEDLVVHYAYCDDIAERELLMLDAFSRGISETSAALLYDKLHPMPFANLTAGSGRKSHGISGARAPRVKRSRRAGNPVAKPSATTAPADESAARLTQRITSGDMRRGIIRIPRLTKEMFPGDAGRVEVSLRGEATSCRWNPRYGPDQERSGVLGLGVELMRRLVSEGEQLEVQRRESVIHLE